MAWTPQQEKAIRERGCSLLVSAAAGSGKTAVLVERILQLVLQEGASLDRMLIITFTRAAAGEMRERIYKGLSKALSAETVPEKKRAVRRQMALTGRADICTFDQFALEVVHRYYHVAGLNPGVGVCDEGRGALLRREAIDELFAGLIEAEDPDFRDFLLRYAGSRDNEAAGDLIISFYVFLQSLPDPDQWMEGLCSGDSFHTDAYLDFAAQRYLQKLKTACAYLEEVSRVLSGLPKLRAKAETDKSRLMEAVALAQSRKESRLTAAAGFSWEIMRASKEEKEGYEQVRDRVDTLRSTAKKLVKDASLYGACTGELLEKEKALSLPVLQELVFLTRSFSARYLAGKLKNNTLDFSDIEHYAIKILKDPRISGEYRSRFTHVFVDEYQDSNLVQDELISRVAGSCNCFMVGDVKQSIYKFRLSEPELFLEKYRGFGSSGRAGIYSGQVIDLNRNFRSSGAVIDTVNRVFSRIMTEESTGIVYDENAALVQGSPVPEGCGNETACYLADTAKEEGAEDEAVEELRAVELEALQAIRIIREYHRRRLIQDEKHPQGRPLEYRDMVILLRSVRSRAEVFYSMLSSAGIPVLLERGEGYFDTPEIRVFLSLLRLLDNRRQDVPLLSVLCFPVFGFNAEELASVRIFGNEAGRKRAPYYEILRLYVEDGPEGDLKRRLGAFLKKLDLWQQRAAYTPLGDFLWSLMTESGILDFASAIPSGTQRGANLRALVDKAASYEEENAGGLHGFLSYFDLLTSRRVNVDTGQVKVLSEGTDAVRIMTVHKSKGLEFPFVLLAGLASRLGGNRKESTLLAHREYGAALKLVRPGEDVFYIPWCHRLLQEKKRAEELAEEIRILYVAMTRPKNILVLSGAMKSPEEYLKGGKGLLSGDVLCASSYMDMLLPVLDRNTITITGREELARLRETVKTDRENLIRCLAEGFPLLPEEKPMTDGELLSRISFVCPVPGENAEKIKYSVSALAQMARLGLAAGERKLTAEADTDQAETDFDSPADRDPDKDGRVPAFLGTDGKLTSAEKGTAYHTVMEHIPFTPEGKSPGEIADFIANLQKQNILTEAEALAVDPWRIAAFFRSSIGKRALAAKQLRKEAPFTLQRMYLGRRILVQGTIDCCFLEEGQWILVDYKSNYVDRTHREEALAHLKETYLPQLALYREALEKITGIPVKEGVLYLFGTDEELPVT